MPEKSPEVIVLCPDLTFPPCLSTTGADGKERVVFDEKTQKALVDISFIDDIIRYEKEVEAQRKIYDAWKATHKIE